MNTRHRGLSRVIDAVWVASPDNRIPIARDHVQYMEKPGWLLLAGWEVITSFGPQGGTVEIQEPSRILVKNDEGHVMLVAELVPSQSADQPREALIVYEDIGQEVVVVPTSQTHFSTRPKKRTMLSLVLALQIIRDHVDSALYLPYDLRSERFRAFAVSSGLDIQEFNRLDDWYHTIAPFAGR